MALACFSLVCFVLHLLPVISVPVTPMNQDIYLAKLNNYTFGILGICDITNDVCTDVSVGYPSKDSSFFLDLAEDGRTFALPTRATLLISRLLVVHIVAFCLSCCHLVVTVFLLILLWFDERHAKCELSDDPDLEDEGDLNRVQSRNSSAWSSARYRIGHRRIVEFEEGRTPHRQLVDDGEVKVQLRDISMYLSFMLMFDLCDFIATLLALLADILLFIPRLTYVGWIQILPLILLAFTASTICFMKREISTRKYLQGGDSIYKNDDMYLRRRMVTEDNDDSGSDDGFYVYTDGFYSNYDKDNQWIHHGRTSTTTVDRLGHSQTDLTMDIPLEDLDTNESRH